MKNKNIFKSMLLVMGIVTVIFTVNLISGMQSDERLPEAVRAADLRQITEEYFLFMPNLFKIGNWESPFGVESLNSVYEGSSLYNYTVDLPTSWLRMNSRISWKDLQPTEGATINWDLLDTFEAELRGLAGTAVRPVVIVDEYPGWAVDPRDDGNLSVCAPIADEHVDEFAAFVGALVDRYSSPEFNVHDWELGNEPDIDPDRISVDSVYGCWGDIDDLQYFGGRRYGRMINTVAPVMRREDPQVRIWMGGLLLDSSDTHLKEGNLSKGLPENFLKGVLAAGAGANLDYIPYHSYPFYFNEIADHDINPQSDWYSWGGYIKGKANFLRAIMQDYQVEIPLVLNESALLCKSTLIFCDPPDQNYWDMQAYHLIRGYTRGMSVDLEGMMWFTIHGPGWENSGLLEPGQTATRKSYDAFQFLISELRGFSYINTVNYGEGTEGYAFERWPSEEIHIVWMFNNVSSTIDVPANKFIAAYDMVGNPITITTDGINVQVPLGFSPVYIHLNP